MIVGILGPGGCGGTFLDWTVQYLGQDSKKLWIQLSPCRNHIKGTCEFDIVHNPLTGHNAHRHHKTHPTELSVKAVIDTFRNHPQFGVHTFYCVDSLAESKTPCFNDLIKQFPDVKFITYQFAKKHIDMIFCLQQEKISDARSRTQQLIMNQLASPLHTLPTWEQRELMSLYYPAAIADQTVNCVIHPAVNNFVLDFDTKVKSLDSKLPELLQYLEIEPKTEQLIKWQRIYSQWKTTNSIEFFDNLDLIINNIVTGTEHDLEQYQMSFAKEVVIASHLLYRHNLALKAYGKNILASNTKQWTEILEPNIYHKLIHV